MELVTGVVIAPQRQTALLAKQAAEIDLLTGGRFRLGLGIGWNDVEYEALGMDFSNRGRRFEEQIELLRRLWTEPVFDFEGRWHTVTAAGINPLPVQRPIPIWIGGSAERALRRAAVSADGFFPQRPLEGGLGRRRSSRCASGARRPDASWNDLRDRPAHLALRARPGRLARRSRRSGSASVRRI